MGTMTNLALNRPTASSSFVKPYEPARAVDGSLAPFSRWLCNTLPGWFSVDLGAGYWINRWVVRHMSTAGWATPDYNIVDFKLQGSIDNNNWFDVDSVTGNTAGITDRTINAVLCRYVRVYVTKGLKCNSQLASMMEFEVYPAPSSQYLTNLTLSSGTLAPVFAGKTTFNYSATVECAVSSITLTPVAEDVHATIKVNGTVVNNNTASQQVNLNAGSNTITVQVTGSDGSAQQNYTITVIRKSSYMSSLVIKKLDGTEVALDPTFNKDTQGYTASVGYDDTSVNVVATSSDGTTNVIVNSQTVPSGQAVTVDNLVVGSNNTINANVVGDKTYTVTLTRADADLYLTKIGFEFSGRGYNGGTSINLDHINLGYTVNASTNAATVTFTPFAEDTSVSITVNNNLTVASGQTTPAIALTGPNMPIPVKVTKTGASTSRDYTIAIIRS